MASEYKPNLGIISITEASVTLNEDGYAGRTIVLNRAGGVTVTMPPATGSGFTYEIIVGTTLTSNGVIATSGIFQGTLAIATDIAGVTVPAASNSNRITMNGGTTGGLRGSRIILQDIASGVWAVAGSLVSTGAEATPFSAV